MYCEIASIPYLLVELFESNIVDVTENKDHITKVKSTILFLTKQKLINTICRKIIMFALSMFNNKIIVYFYGTIEKGLITLTNTLSQIFIKSIITDSSGASGMWRIKNLTRTL